MKIVRLGKTEAGLLILNYASKLNDIEPYLKKRIRENIIILINWLYTTSGFYDKNVKGDNFNFNIRAKNESYTEFIKHLQESVKKCERVEWLIHEGIVMYVFKRIEKELMNDLQISKYELINNIPFSIRLPEIYRNMEKKKVLVVSSFAELIQSQYEEGNVYKAGLGFPSLCKMETVQVPYCFHNNGPHKNYFETLEYLFSKIQEKTFDIAILGCGCYGHMLCHKIDKILKRDAIYVGGSITTMFGIMSSREKTNNDIVTNEHWIMKIPEKYKPENYKNIEDGCYW